MDKPCPLSCSTHKPNLPVRLTMLTSHTPLRLISCTLLLLLLISTSGESRPHVAHEGTPDAGRMDSRKVLLLEAVKTGILSSLGMDREPRPTRKASEQELRQMYQLYREQMREMRRNSSQSLRETQQSVMSTVLFPVEPLKVLRRQEHPHSGQRMQWYRAVFRNNQSIQTELTIARAELKISWQILDERTSVHPEVKEVKVRVNGRKLRISAARKYTDSVVHNNMSNTQDMILDIRSEVHKWMRTDGQSLLMDVGMVVVDRKALKPDPTISLELGLQQPKPAKGTRLRRSDKEDDCDTQGWCCRKSVTVSFKDIGWMDWVVAPAEYTMHFCDGTCPHNYKPASMHTQLKSRLHQSTNGRTPHPCCVPAAYEPMVLMHYDSREKLKLTPFSDFIVSKCHCA
ncbi:growth/differentiation factor 8 [Brachyistius frenatus]|uniref:growth/differentiation factor 8 n=1 Tax=Brachyistius frenatus TaxID=100188 RepID=UPI0037E7C934